LRSDVVKVNLVLVAGCSEADVRGEAFEGDELAVGGDIGVPAIVVERYVRGCFGDELVYAPGVDVDLIRTAEATERDPGHKVVCIAVERHHAAAVGDRGIRQQMAVALLTAGVSRDESGTACGDVVDVNLSGAEPAEIKWIGSGLEHKIAAVARDSRKLGLVTGHADRREVAVHEILQINLVEGRTGAVAGQVRECNEAAVAGNRGQTAAPRKGVSVLVARDERRCRHHPLPVPSDARAVASLERERLFLARADACAGRKPSAGANPARAAPGPHHTAAPQISRLPPPADGTRLPAQGRSVRRVFVGRQLSDKIIDLFRAGTLYPAYFPHKRASVTPTFQIRIPRR
jgi:hypothetical protein